MTATPLNLSDPPYVGPRAFSAGQRLYGREREARDLRALLVSERIVLLHSPSGAGKSSLLNARLIPDLQKQQFAVQPVLRVSLSTASSDGNRYLNSVALSLQPRDPGLKAAAGLPPGLTLPAFLDARPSAANPGGEVLIFDQFEEILTQDPTDIAAKREFFRQLGEALRNPLRWALFAMREDHIAALAPYLPLLPTRLSCTFRLDLLDRAGAAAAIAGPPAERGVTVDPAVVEALVRNLSTVQVQGPDGRATTAEGPYVEPVQLQVVCLRMWEDWLARRSADATTIAPGEVDAGDSVGGALRAYYERRVGEVAKTLSDGEQPGQRAAARREREIREWFDQHLITPGGIRGQILQGVERTEGLGNDDVQQLVDAYLVRSERRGGRTWYELAHDRLIDPIQASNADWRRERLVPAQVQAALWERQDRPEGLLLRGAALQAAERWASTPGVDLNATERDYLEACRRLARRRALTRSLVVGVVALGLAAGAFGVWALIVQRQATARLLTTQASTTAPGLPQRALLLAAAAVDGTRPFDPLPEAVSALYGALAPAGGTALPGEATAANLLALSPDGRYLAAGGGATIALWDLRTPDAPPRQLRGFGGLVTALAFGPDGSLAAVGIDAPGNGGIRLRLWTPGAAEPARLLYEAGEGNLSGLVWNAAGELAVADGSRVLIWPAGGQGEPLALGGASSGLNSLAWSPDGRRIAGGAADGSLHIWQPGADATAGAQREGGGAALTQIAWSPDGQAVAAADEDGRILLWSLARPAQAALTLKEPQILVSALAFAPDGTSLAAATAAGTAQLWNLADPTAAPTVLEGGTTALLSLAWSPDSRSLAGGSADGAVRLWAVAAPGQVRVLRGHEGTLFALAFAPDGASLYSLGDDRQVRHWNLLSPGPIPALPVSDLAVRTIFADSDGRLVAVASDGRAVAWERPDAGGGRELRPAGETLSAAAAPLLDGQAVVAATASGVELHDLTSTGLPPRTLPGGEGEAATVAVSPDSSAVAGTLNGGELLLWRLDPSGEASLPARLPGAAQSLAALAFSADSSTLAASSVGAIQLWHLANSADPVTLGPQGVGASALAFGPDDTLAAGDSTGAIRLYNRERQVTTTLRGHDGPIVVLAWSPDGGTLASASGDRTVRLWRLAAPAESPVVLRFERAVAALHFTADGSSLITGGRDGVVQIWPLDLSRLSQAACATAGRNLTLDEWQAAFGAAPYERTCAELPPSATLLEQAAALVRGGEADAGWRLAERAMALDADKLPANAWRRLCRAGALADDPERALLSCDRAVAGDAGDPGAFDGRAIARARSGDVPGALADLERFLALAPSSGVASFQVAERTRWRDMLLDGTTPFSAETLALVQAEGDQ